MNLTIMPHIYSVPTEHLHSSPCDASLKKKIQWQHPNTIIILECSLYRSYFCVAAVNRLFWTRIKHSAVFSQHACVRESFLTSFSLWHNHIH